MQAFILSVLRESDKPALSSKDTPGDAVTQVAQQQLMILSDERDQWSALVGETFRLGYAAALHDHQDDYRRGLLDGAGVRKRAEHDLVAFARLELARWGPGGREHFGDPRPGDFTGRALRPLDLDPEGYQPEPADPWTQYQWSAECPDCQRVNHVDWCPRRGAAR